MKQTYSIAFLTFIYAVGTIGLFTSYYTAYHRTTFQVKVKETKDQELTKLFFSKQEFESIVWLEEETEFEWQGKLYDVSKISRANDGYIVLCENDAFEEVLLSFLKSTKSNREGQGTRKGSPQPQFYVARIDVNRDLNIHMEREMVSFSPCFYNSIYPGIHLPPPKS